jgi:cytochrome c-type biogenesis protein CcmH
MKANVNEKKFILIFLFILAVQNFWPSLAFPATVGDVTDELTCTCGCNMVVSACEGAMECSAAGQIKEQVRNRLDKGESKGQILKYFVGAYGEKILSAPTKKGFNLTAWIMPFFALLMGGGAIYLLLLKWFSRGKLSSEKAVANERHGGGEYLQRVENELKHFDY